jgi:hypothetical protein
MMDYSFWLQEEVIPPIQLLLHRTGHEPREDFDSSQWSQEVWISYAQRRISPVAENSAALRIDDSRARKEIAALAGLDSIPKSESRIDELSGLFDSLFSKRDEVDVTKWVRSIRQRSE